LNLSSEALLIIGVIGFYIYDSLHLVFHNQIIFTETSKDWGAIFPGNRFRVGSKFIYLANVFMPFQSVFLFSWPAIEKSPNKTQLNTLNKFLNSLIIFRILSVILWLTLIIVLPPILLMYGTIFNLLTLMAVIYFTATLMVFFLWRLKKELNLSNKDFLSIAMDVLACPPFGINVVRKITLKQKLNFTPIEFAKKQLSKKSYLLFAHVFNEKLEDSIDACDDGSNYKKQLIEYRQKLRIN
jgi:hypothetical protein